jgi:hypothetical protein
VADASAEVGLADVVKRLDTIACLIACQVRGETSVPKIMGMLARLGLGHAEIGSLLAMTPNAVKVALYQARKKGAVR